MIVRSVPTTVLLASLLTPLGGPAHRKTEQGNEHYLADELDRALAAYTEAQVAAPDAAELHYDIGNVLYRQGDFPGAAEAFERALVSAGPELKPMAAYNLGNAQFRQQEFAKAAESFRRALEHAPGDRDAKRNLELALRALEQQPPQGEGPQPEEKEDGPPQEQPQPPQPQQEDEKGPQGAPSPSPSASPGPGRGSSPMTPEQATRLLDGAADEERAAKREEAARAARGGERSREKDW